MERELYEILLTGGGMGMIYVIYLIVKVIFGKKGNGQGATEVLQVIQGNDLKHIGDDIKSQNDILDKHTDKLDKMITLLTEINTTLKLK